MKRTPEEWMMLWLDLLERFTEEWSMRASVTKFAEFVRKEAINETCDAVVAVSDRHEAVHNEPTASEIFNAAEEAREKLLNG